MYSPVKFEDDAPDKMPVLSQEDISFFRENGYLVVRNMTSLRHLAQLRQIYEILFFNQTGLGEGNYFDLVGASAELRLAKGRGARRLRRGGRRRAGRWRRRLWPCHGRRLRREATAFGG